MMTNNSKSIQVGSSVQAKAARQKNGALALLLGQATQGRRLPQTGQASSVVGNLQQALTPVERDMIQLALRRSPEQSAEALRAQSAQTLAAIQRVRQAPAAQQPQAFVAEIARLRRQGMELPDVINQVPLEKVDALLSFFQQRAAEVLELVVESDRLNELEQMLTQAGGTGAPEQISAQEVPPLEEPSSDPVPPLED